MRLINTFPRLTLSRLSLAVLLALSVQAVASVDYRGNVVGKNQPATGSQDWFDTGAIWIGVPTDGKVDSILSITGGSVVMGRNGELLADSQNGRQLVTVSDAGSRLDLSEVVLYGRTNLTIANGAQVDIRARGADGSIYVGFRSVLNVRGAGTQLNLHDDQSEIFLGGGILNLSEGAVINANSNSDPNIFSKITMRNGATVNIGGEQGKRARAPGILDIEHAEFNTNDNNTLNFNHTASDYVFNTKITSLINNGVAGKGLVNVASGTTILTAQNDYTGETHITGGTLKAGAENTFSANSTYDITSGGTLDLNGFSHTLGDTVNAGIINLASAGKTAGALLTVDGNYTGNDGTMIFGTKLEGDTSKTDRLIITGDATGTTNVKIKNLGGSGAQTLNGIELIEVHGNADRNAFSQDGRIVAGAYDYNLFYQGGKWYLSSYALEKEKPLIPGDRVTPTDPEHDHDAGLEPWMPIIPGDGGDDGDNGGGDDGDNGGGDDGDDGDNGGGDGDNGNGGGQMVLRPEAGAYAANLATASTLFDTRMSDRQGTYYTDMTTGEEQYTSMWLRTAGNHNRVNGGSGQLNTRSNSFVTMLGGDIAATDTARLGLMAGYGNSKSNTKSDITGYGAKGQINGYTTGMYGTWFAEGSNEQGLWVDGTLQYSWFNNSVSGDDAASESYKSKGMSASLSTGYVIPLGEGARTGFFLQPQARVGWSGIKAEDHTESNGTHVQSSGDGNISSSLGVKAFMNHAGSSDSRVGAFTEVNWINNSKQYAVKMDNVSVSQSGSRNIAEARVGIDGGFGNGFGVQGTLGQQVGDKGWSDTSAAVNFSYKF